MIRHEGRTSRMYLKVYLADLESGPTSSEKDPNQGHRRVMLPIKGNRRVPWRPVARAQAPVQSLIDTEDRELEL